MFKYKIDNKKIVAISNKIKSKENNSYNEVIRILSYILKKDKIYVITNINKLNLSLFNYIKFKYLIFLLKKQYPIDYILKKRDFYKHTFYIEKGVLIPRPETEFLVEEVIKICYKLFYKNGKKGKQPNNNKYNNYLSLLEIGTGSGCIIISVVNEINSLIKNQNIKNNFFLFYGIDISEKSLKIGKINEKNILKSNCIKWLKGDIFKEKYFKKNDIKFDLIFSNPPYISKNDFLKLDKKIRKYEPKRALLSKDDGDYFYKKIYFKTFKFLKKSGYYVFEVGENKQAKRIIDFYTKVNFDYYIVNDYNNINRVLVFYKK